MADWSKIIGGILGAADSVTEQLGLEGGRDLIYMAKRLNNLIEEVQTTAGAGLENQAELQARRESLAEAVKAHAAREAAALRGE